MYAKINETNADFVWCECKMTGNRIFSFFFFLWSNDKSENVANLFLNRRIGVPTWNKLIKREIYEKVSFPDVHLVSGEDPVQTLQIAYYSKSAVFVSEELYFFKEGIGDSAIVKLKEHIKIANIINHTFEILFNGSIPQNVKKSLCKIVSAYVHLYYFLNKKEREPYKNDIEPFLPGLIKYEKKTDKKICFILLNIGIEFPYIAREKMKLAFKKSQKGN
jgi:hypothetical protein